MNLVFAPNGADASATMVASQNADDHINNANITMTVDLFGTSSGSFVLDPATGTMDLTTSAGLSGDVTILGVGTICANFVACGVPPTRISSSLIVFSFQDGVVTASANSLGLALPAVGSAANFAFTSLSPFGITLPNVPSSLFSGFLSTVTITEADSQSANLVAPEPGTFAVTSSAS